MTAGIYPDPSGQYAWRRWDGDQWGDAFGTLSRLQPNDAVQQAAGLLAARGATVSIVTDRMIAGQFRDKQSANPAVAILLLFLCIVPGIVYLVAGGRDDVYPFTIDVSPHPNGTAFIPNGAGGRLAGAALSAMY